MPPYDFRMKVSVIIVNYNVKEKLKQCLCSVQIASQNIENEVFVVDNNSTDGSCEMVRAQFPNVIVIANEDNVGFAKANNQAIQCASGEYVLLLNPDTVVQSDMLEKVLTFMDEHPDGGALGVAMEDGNGVYLPESKRGMPTPWTAFCKLFGLSSLFPKSDFFNHYYLGSLSNNDVHEIEILAGACMLLRKSVLDKIGLLDEKYFLYGEDIDISYRIVQAGFKNYYFPFTRITHYKGLSTQKKYEESLRAFYSSMIIFVDQHFAPRYSSPAIWCIKCGIQLREALAIMGMWLKNMKSAR